ncbi:hypothetical protein CEXT_612731 [Caerostris extrusa]|uniref:LAGLIDADG homing endonuclease n=1 Tax=Caerostris extrusa TaxID=172846 RepID=A0AAV4XBP9_CAEEX|nr:hypothetical protein CEXT_612731 [Caerostris extrusa]
MKSKAGFLTVGGDSILKTTRHTFQVGVCTLIGDDSRKVIDTEIMSVFCKSCFSYKGAEFGLVCAKWLIRHKPISKEKLRLFWSNESGGMLRIFQRSKTCIVSKINKILGMVILRHFILFQKKKKKNDRLDYALKNIGLCWSRSEKKGHKNKKAKK